MRALLYEEYWVLSTVHLVVSPSMHKVVSDLTVLIVKLKASRNLCVCVCVCVCVFVVSGVFET